MNPDQYAGLGILCGLLAFGLGVWALLNELTGPRPAGRPRDEWRNPDLRGIAFLASVVIPAWVLLIVWLTHRAT